MPFVSVYLDYNDDLSDARCSGRTFVMLPVLQGNTSLLSYVSVFVPRY